MSIPAPHVQVPAPYQGKPITTDLVQKVLDENRSLIFAVLENQNLQRLAECSRYQARLQQNLIFLATVADAQPGLRKRSPSEGAGEGPASLMGPSSSAPAPSPATQSAHGYMRSSGAPSSTGMPTPHHAGYTSYATPHGGAVPASSAYGAAPYVQTPQPVSSPHTGMPSQTPVGAYPSPQQQQSAYSQPSPMSPASSGPSAAPGLHYSMPATASLPPQMIRRTGISGGPQQGMPQQGMPQQQQQPQYGAQATMQQPQQQAGADGQDRPWTPDENRRFIDALRAHGPKDLDQIVYAVQTRSKMQVQIHLQKYIHKVREEQAKQQQLAAQQQAQQQQQPHGYPQPTSAQPKPTPQQLAHLTPQQLAQLSQRSQQGSNLQQQQQQPPQAQPQQQYYQQQQQQQPPQPSQQTTPSYAYPAATQTQQQQQQQQAQQPTPNYYQQAQMLQQQQQQQRQMQMQMARRTGLPGGLPGSSAPPQQQPQPQQTGMPGSSASGSSHPS